MDNLLVSIIIPTKNSSRTLESCLKSIKEQSYKNIETIVIDNSSNDNTKDISRKYTDKVFNYSPERSAQRNFGVKNSKGEYLLIIDSDMELSKDVVKSCVEKILLNKEIKSLVIPEESFGEGFWAQCKKLERSFYVGVDWMEAARFFDKEIYLEVKGYDEEMVSGEDWDLSQRFELLGKVGRIDNFIYHNEGNLSLLKTLKKKYYYASKFEKYKNTNLNKLKIKKQSSILERYKLFLSNFSKIIENPILWTGMIFMKTLEFGFGALGYLIKNIIQKLNFV